MLVIIEALIQDIMHLPAMGPESLGVWGHTPGVNPDISTQWCLTKQLPWPKRGPQDYQSP